MSSASGIGPTRRRDFGRVGIVGAIASTLVIGCAGSGSNGVDARGSGASLRVGVAVVDVTPASWERFHDRNANGLWDFAEGEAFDDFGRDGLPDPDEPGYDAITHPDPAGDDYDALTNPAGTENDGRFQPIWMAGFDNAHPALGVHDPITVRAVAFELGGVTTALVALDAVGMLSPSFQPALDRVAAETGLDPRRVIVASIHDHQAPDTLGLWGKTQYESGIDPVHLDQVNDGIADAVAEALATLREARLQVVSVPLDLGIADPFLDHRALDPQDPPLLANDTRLPSVRDHELLAIQALGDDDATIATILAWANHPESIGARNNLLSADFPGYARTRLEARLGGTAIYLSGAVGGLITPLDGARVPYWSESGERGTHPVDGREWIADDGFDKARSLGFELAEQAMAALANASPVTVPSLAFHRREALLPMENLNLVLGLVAGVIPGSETFFTRDGGGLFDFSDPDHCGHCGCVRAPLFRIDLGDAATIVTAPGELFPESLGGRPESEAAFPTPAYDYGTETFPAIEGLRTMRGAPNEIALVGLAPDELGYLIPQSDYLDFTVEEFLFGGTGSPLEHPNFYSEWFSLGPRAGDVVYCDLIELLDLTPAPATRQRCAALAGSGFADAGADAVCKLVRALPGPLSDSAQLASVLGQSGGDG